MKKSMMFIFLMIICFTMTGCVNPVKKIISHYVNEAIEEAKEEVQSEIEESNTTEESSNPSSSNEPLSIPKSPKNPALVCQVTATSDNTNSTVYFEVKDNVKKEMEGYMISTVDLSGYGSIDGFNWDSSFCASNKLGDRIKDCYTIVNNKTLYVYYIFDMEKMIEEYQVTDSVDLRDVLRDAKTHFDSQGGYSCELWNMN